MEERVGAGGWSLEPPEVPTTSDDKTEEAMAHAIVVVAMALIAVVVVRIPRGS